MTKGLANRYKQCPEPIILNNCPQEWQTQQLLLTHLFSFAQRIWGYLVVLGCQIVDVPLCNLLKSGGLCAFVLRI